MMNTNFETIQLDNDLTLQRDENGLFLSSGDQILRGDFTKMIPRVKASNIPKEFLVKAAKIKDADHPLTAIDATAGLGEDSLLLAAAGFQVTLFERNPVIAQLLADALERAKEIPELAPIVARMTLRNEDSIEALNALALSLDRSEPDVVSPDVILLDPMFPERQKSALVKKKLQMIQKLEMPCDDEKALVRAAMTTRPKKLIIKRPPKGPWLAGLKPDYFQEGKAVRFDCFVQPFDRIHKFDL